MGEIKPLFNSDAVEKIREMTGDGNIVLFCCNLDEQPFDATPMSTQAVDDDGTIWFFSTKDSDRNKYVKRDPRVQVLYSDTGSQDYLSIYGKAEVLNDRQKAEELWTSFAKVWFPEGPTDPNLSLIRFRPSEGFYWDTKNGKMVAFAKMMASMVTGKTMDDSVEGKLKL
ncbi:pyridoxamine 5'-phosphate oxidase family protein [Flavilitoribacter nigricans]|uniref:General stress protein n=1 Tax=Flavilitoribacter nigricans (strain ATCC 23147 / DSM 23189 / NBRC 102662 / NCIMB 1420 / SS-2) TaxID=1122177 RepID=A0A2D0N5H7_FLAN2|nr:pyridoxamine 5'-phosphate oxidase family protein [Flavilitoribacter nigricans]PHN03755.1 general stress protein [Flavilitoribacter nigricans DSM 23189 = NBRC 102662]